MNKSYLLSILVPTQNRYETLLPLLEYLFNFDNKQVEIIIEDNSENNKMTKKIRKKISGKKNIKYSFSSKSISVTDNFNKALERSSGEYICSIGDDDGVMPYAIDIVKWMKNKKIHCLTAMKPDYSWPGQKYSFLSDDVSGVLSFSKFEYSAHNICTQTELLKVLSKGGTEMCKLPSVYHGIIKRSALVDLQKISGSFFPGPSPDIANAIGLTALDLNCYYLDLPLFISGKQVKSGAGMGVNRKHISSIDGLSHLPKNINQSWNKKIPKYWTGETIYAQTIITALENTARHDLIGKLNFPYLYA
ncbi:glycosyltransferase, partial [Candidatus Marinimicrobia bacterium]|nr:glycosyltransferase [Candidatus Neomarinimicrobiota bacterium]